MRSNENVLNYIFKVKVPDINIQRRTVNYVETLF